jgi:hypothetical protein
MSDVRSVTRLTLDVKCDLKTFGTKTAQARERMPQTTLEGVKRGLPTATAGASIPERSPNPQAWPGSVLVCDGRVWDTSSSPGCQQDGDGFGTTMPA